MEGGYDGFGWQWQVMVNQETKELTIGVYTWYQPEPKYDPLGYLSDWTHFSLEEVGIDESDLPARNNEGWK